MQILQQLASIFFDSDHPNIERVEIQELGQHYREEIHPLFLDQIWVASAYIYTRDILERYKYHSEREYIEPLSRYLIALAEHADIRVEESSDWIIVPVPMHWSRYILRGFDHIGLLSEQVSRATGIPTLHALRTSFRFRQSKLSRSSRLANKKNAFRMNSGISLHGKEIILIDDVISSGSTANACAEVLRLAGAEKVIGWFIASNN